MQLKKDPVKGIFTKFKPDSLVYDYLMGEKNRLYFATWYPSLETFRHDLITRSNSLVPRLTEYRFIEMSDGELLTVWEKESPSLRLKHEEILKQKDCFTYYNS